MFSVRNAVDRFQLRSIILPLLLVGVIHSSIASAQTDINRMPVEIGSIRNFPLVSVTICTPRTETCQTIDRIKLDTGSVGLRIYREATNLALPKIVDATGASIGLCQRYGGGSNMWGPLQVADVILGKEKAQNVPVQIVDPGFIYRDSPAFCPRPAHSVQSDGANGQLGIGLGKGDHFGARYFSCTPGLCTPTTTPPTTIRNPIPYLLNDNNGFTISFPDAASPGQALTGSLYLGLERDPTINRQARDNLQDWFGQFFPCDVRGTPISVRHR